MVRVKHFFYLLFICCSRFSGQELPPIIRFDAETYFAGNQNWMITQDDRRFIYSANNEGLLQYNGATWTLYPSPNETIIRSVKAIGNRIYTGCYMEFGYWQRNNRGLLEYNSLSANIRSKIIDDEQIWNIFSYDNWVIFQSLNQLYLYDTKSKQFKIISSKSGILKAFQTGNSFYYQPVEGGLFEIENGQSKVVIDRLSLGDLRIINVFNVSEGIMLQTQRNGFYLFHDGLLKQYPFAANDYFANTTIYSSLLLANGSYALGSISNGLFIISTDGDLLYHITQNQGLGNNTVLSLFEDADKNLWIGLDNGINCINISSPIKSFADNTGILGTVYTSIVFGGKLYIGTNQGLFVKKDKSSEEFRLISGTKGQVWTLFDYKNSLFCGHDSGTLIISEEKAQNISSGSGTWKLSVNPKNPNQLLQGNYTGLSILENGLNGWQFKHKIPGFNYSCKYYEVSGNNIYVSHEYKGVFKLELNSDFSKVTQFKTYSYPPKGKNASLVKYNNTIYYAFKDGIFKLNPKKDTFEKDPQFSKAIDKDAYTSGKMIVDQSKKLWIFTKNSINYFTIGKLSNVPKLNSIQIPSALTNSMLGYENISHLDANKYLVGTTDGYYYLDVNELRFNKYHITINGMTSNKFNEPPQYIILDGTLAITNVENNISFNYSVPVYNKYIKPEYQYRLEGISDRWSEWSSRPAVTFKNLSAGKYSFKVRARIGGGLSENVALRNFTILRPWYFSIVAMLIYLIAIVVIARLIHKRYKSYYQKQRDNIIAENNRQLELKQLENEQQLMRVKNEQLLLDVESKNRELAVSTMNLIKKNELLSLIKDDLKKNNEDSKNIKTVISTINKNISEEDTWDLFKEAFNNADKDFLKKTKKLHPLLTPNDLRLCAYLRLNLSSKEIAPLLNISVRSVEIKRYRLRKKMDLPHEQGLVEHILSI